jgi:2,4-dienoyl-CoA reductase-like NADH-dependent reductase (Old Yellow Enzyme family)
MRRAVDLYRGITKHPIGIQIGHAGRKASTHPPFAGGKPLGPGESPWQTIAPSPIPFSDWHVPHEMSSGDIKGLIDAFVASAGRAKRIGFDVLELHSAHGYLLQQFLSPLSNQRKDDYGRNPMKLPLEVAAAVREVWPKDRALGARINGSDWAEGGWAPEDAVEYAKALKKVGLDFVCVSSGGTVAHQKVPVTPGYQVPFAEKVKPVIKTRAVGMIADPNQAEEILTSGKADMIAMARAFLDDPRWVWHAAERLGVTIDYPRQYARSRHDLWPGAKLARAS